MKNKKGVLLISCGLVLIAVSLCMVGFNLYESTKAAKSVEEINAKIDIPQNKTAVEQPLYITHPDIEMPTKEIDGNSYIGVLEIPSLELNLPVISQWSDTTLKIAPSRYAGSAYTDDMVIAAHAYRRHFGQIRQLNTGDSVIFTDIDGNRFEYTVSFTEILPSDGVEDMLAGQWDLTMFTCTVDASNRVTVRCTSKNQTEPRID